MKKEVQAAVNFVCTVMNPHGKIRDEKLELFRISLNDILIDRYTNHWHESKPSKGQAYRCLRINSVDKKERSIYAAATQSGINYADITLPVELTIWVDPDDVCCRFGERKGSCCAIASFKNGNEESNISDIDFRNLPTAAALVDGSESDEDVANEAKTPTWNKQSPLFGTSGNQSPIATGPFINVGNGPSAPFNVHSGMDSPPFTPTSPLSIGYLQQPMPGLNTYVPNPPLVFPPRRVTDYKSDWITNYVPVSQPSYSLVQVPNSMTGVTIPPDYIGGSRCVPNFVNKLNWVNNYTAVM